MRRTLFLSGVFCLGLVLQGYEVQAQPAYYNPPAPHNGFAPRPANWQPAARPNWYQPPQPYAAQQPIGVGVLPAPNDAGGPTGYTQPAAPQYPTHQYPTHQYPAPQYATTQYPTTQNSTPRYPAPPISSPRNVSVQYPAVQYPHAQYPGTQPSVPHYASPPNPGRTYPGPAYGDTVSNMSPTKLPGTSAAFQPHNSASGHLFEASANEMHSGGEPIESSVVQQSPQHSGPAAELWSTDADLEPKSASPAIEYAYGTVGPRWYGGIYALFMTRDQENNVWLSYDTNDFSNRVLSSHDASHSFAAGVETRIGHYFGNGPNAVEFVYWGIFPGTEEANAYATDVGGDLDTVLHFDGISYDPGGGPDLLNDSFYQAERHYLKKEYSLQNFELNLIETNYRRMCGAAHVNLSWMAGLRYISFDEEFQYSTDPWDNVFTGDPDEVHYAIDATNDLFGFQIGGRADVCFTPGFTTYLDTKLGLYSNHSSQHSRIYGSNGSARVSDGASPYFDTALDIESKKSNAAIAGEFRIGLDYQFSCCWSATIGYRALALTGVALSTNQIPGDYIQAIDSLQSVHTNGCLIAHGAFAGLEFCH